MASYLKPPPSRKGWGHKTPATLTIDVEDGAGGVAVFEMKIWEYISVDVERQLTPGANACVRGVLSGKTPKGAYTLEKPTMAMHVDPQSEVEVVPTYPKKHDVAPDKWPDIQKAAVKALKASIPADPMEVSLGLESTVLPELELMSHVDAMAHIHAPDSVESVCAARERLAFEELVLLQVSLLRERNRAQNSGGEGISVVSTALCDELRSVLDFSLTRGQENAMEEILHDMAGTKPMLRMLQGDVGCGKTIVAALAILAAVGNGHQGAFMAPRGARAATRAFPHPTLEPHVRPARVILLTGSMTKKPATPRWRRSKQARATSSSARTRSSPTTSSSNPRHRGRGRTAQVRWSKRGAGEQRPIVAMFDATTSPGGPRRRARREGTRGGR